MVIAGLSIAVGVIVLFAGRRFAWFFVGALTFLVTLSLLSSSDMTFVSQVILAAVLGVVLGLAAVPFQGLMVVLAAFAGGGWLGMVLLAGREPFMIFGQSSTTLGWAAFLLGGFTCAFLVLSVVDWALIIASAAAGAWLIIATLREPVLATVRDDTIPWMIIGLTLLGMVIQGNRLTAERYEERG